MVLRKSRIFLDANILISGVASTTGASGYILELLEFRTPFIQGVVSRQVLAEAERNIKKKLPGAMPKYKEIIGHINLEVIQDPSNADVAAYISLVHQGDSPILAAAVKSMSDYLITLDKKHFMTQTLRDAGLSSKIVTPGEFITIHLPEIIIDQ